MTTNNTQIQAVVFDWAGTTVDFGSRAPILAFMALFKDNKVEITVEEARAPMGLEKRDHITAVLKCHVWQLYGRKSMGSLQLKQILTVYIKTLFRIS